MTSSELKKIIASLPDPKTYLNDRIQYPNAPQDHKYTNGALQPMDKNWPTHLTFRKKYNYQRQVTGWELVK